VVFLFHAHNLRWFSWSFGIIYLLFSSKDEFIFMAPTVFRPLPCGLKGHIKAELSFVVVGAWASFYVVKV